MLHTIPKLQTCTLRVNPPTAKVQVLTKKLRLLTSKGSLPHLFCPNFYRKASSMHPFAYLPPPILSEIPPKSLSIPPFWCAAEPFWWKLAPKGWGGVL
ncbi:MAG: hypothetical protein NW226_07335 [Microscillaceae bacterium]|nr:hypothetical protein [Microscillaceae bacterium]